MPKVFLNGTSLHFQQCRGSGPDILMVHGLAANLSFWYFRIVPFLMRHFRLTLYDLRGHGESDMPSSGYTTLDMATDLHGLLDHLELERVHLVGHSYGGAVALHYSVLHPERVASLTLADARIRAFQPVQRLDDWPNPELWERKLKELGVSFPGDDSEMGYRVLEVLAEAKVQGKAETSTALGSFSPFGLSKTSNRTAKRWLQLLRSTTARKDFTDMAGLTLERIHQVNHPVLAIYGEFSHCMPSCWGLKQHLPNCRVVIVPKVGHFHPVVKPTFFGKSLRKFLVEIAA